ncbi:Hypothetical Protein FCC1311_056142, partial [Hondaea fermentalgiana]
YFGQLPWTNAAQAAITLGEPEWIEWVQTISRMGKLLEAPKTVEAAINLRLACKLMQDDFEAQELVDMNQPVFEEFWKRGRAVCSCIMQGGKTRRAIFYRGLVHAGVHNKHAVVLANGMGVAYNDLLSSMKDLNEDYVKKVPKKLREKNRYLPTEELFLGTRLNQKDHFRRFEDRQSGQVHFNIRLSSVANLRTLSAAFRGQLEFNSENTHLLLDESHEAMGRRLFSTHVRSELAEWKDVTLVTATPQAQFIAEDLLGSKFRLVNIVPRPGYYLYGPKEENPSQDSEDGKVLVVNVPDEEITALGKICRRKHSFFCIVLNNHEGQNPNEGGRSVNVGHGVIAKWVMQQAVSQRMQFKEPGVRASVVTYTVFQHSRVSSEFSRPRLFFNKEFLKALARIRLPGVDNLVSSIFTEKHTRSNERVLVTKKVYKLLTDFFKGAVPQAVEVYNGKPLNDESVFSRYRTTLDSGKVLTTYSLQLPRLEIKAVLSIIRYVHETRFSKSKYKSYKSAPLQLAVVGGTLLKQSVNVESKCRELQSTHLMYMRKPGERFDLTRLLQKLGRVDHGHTQSSFYRSAFPGKKRVDERRPTVVMNGKYINLVLNSPRMLREAAEKGSDALITFFREVWMLSLEQAKKRATIMSCACRELEETEAEYYERVRDMNKLSAWILNESNVPNVTHQDATDIAQAIKEQFTVVGQNPDMSREGLIDIFDFGVDASSLQRKVHSFLGRAPAIPARFLTFP